MQPEATPDRRSVLTGCLAAVLGAGALAACGSSSSDAGTTTTTTSGGGTPGPSSGGPGASASATGAPQAIVKLADVPVGGAVAATAPSGNVIVAQPTAGQVVAFSAICPHAAVKVAPVGTLLVCPGHGSKFETATGKVLNGPAKANLTPVAVKVSGQDVVAG